MFEVEVHEQYGELGTWDWTVKPTVGLEYEGLRVLEVEEVRDAEEGYVMYYRVKVEYI